MDLVKYFPDPMTVSSLPFVTEANKIELFLSGEITAHRQGVERGRQKTVAKNEHDVPLTEWSSLNICHKLDGNI